MYSKKAIHQNTLLVCFAMLSLIAFEGYRIAMDYNTTKKTIQKKVDQLLINSAKKYGQELFLSNITNSENASFALQPLEIDSIPIGFNVATLDTNLSDGLEMLMITSAITEDSNFLTSFTDSLVVNGATLNIKSLTVSIEGSAVEKQEVTRKLKNNGWGSYSFYSEYPIVIDSDSHTLKMWGSTNMLPEQRALILLLFFILIVVFIVGWSFTRLIRQIERVQHYQQVNEQYFFGLIHDLKTPLSYTKTLLDRIHITLVEKDEGAAVLVNEGNLQVDRLAAKVNELLAIPKLTSCSEKDFKEGYLTDIVEQIEDELIYTYSNVSPTFNVHIDSDKSYYLPMEHLTILLRILMDNAVRYSGDTPKVIIDVVEHEKQLIISISDNGGGLPIAQTQLRFSEKSGIETIDGIVKGHGIGLITAIRIMSALGGCLLYERIEGGSKFTIDIPIKK
ncbi:two-component system sensor histidine kinase [Porphyromonas sp. CAG:1061]|nr:two-component system sensor histidine kinase [Porphyromonas sp. CAG:1061]